MRRLSITTLRQRTDRHCTRGAHRSENGAIEIPLRYRLESTCSASRGRMGASFVPTSLPQQITLKLVALEDSADLLKVLRIVFLFPETFCPNKFTKNMPPFLHRFETKEEIEIKVLIVLEDGSSHHFTYRPLLDVIWFHFFLAHLELVAVWCRDCLFTEPKC
jgi:hypothetical protein